MTSSTILEQTVISCMNNEVEVTHKELLSKYWYIFNTYTYNSSDNFGKIHFQSRRLFERIHKHIVLVLNSQNNSVVLTKQLSPITIDFNEKLIIDSVISTLDSSNFYRFLKPEITKRTGYCIKEIMPLFVSYSHESDKGGIKKFYVAKSASTKSQNIFTVKGSKKYTETVELEITEVIHMIKLGIIDNGKLIMLIQYLKDKNML